MVKARSGLRSGLRWRPARGTPSWWSSPGRSTGFSSRTVRDWRDTGLPPWHTCRNSRLRKSETWLCQKPTNVSASLRRSFCLTTLSARRPLMEMLSEDDLNLAEMTREELDRAWNLWFDLAQTTNDSDPLYTHGVFVLWDRLPEVPESREDLQAASRTDASPDKAAEP